MREFTKPKLSEYLKKSGWDIINDLFYLNEKENTFIKIEDSKLHYFIDNKEVNEVPLVFILHHELNIEAKEDYYKIIRLLEILSNKGLIPLYQNHCYRFEEFSDEFWGFQQFYGILIYIEDGGIESTPEGVSEYKRYFGDNLAVQDEVVKNLIIELTLKINPDYYFDTKSESFEIAFNRKKEIIQENKSGWSG